MTELEPSTILISLEDLRVLHLADDPFHLYAERRSLQKAGIPTPIYRNTEWWHGCQSKGGRPIGL